MKKKYHWDIFWRHAQCKGTFTHFVCCKTIPLTPHNHPTVRPWILYLHRGKLWRIVWPNKDVQQDKNVTDKLSNPVYHYLPRNKTHWSGPPTNINCRHLSFIETCISKSVERYLLEIWFFQFYITNLNSIPEIQVIFIIFDV